MTEIPKQYYDCAFFDCRMLHHDLETQRECAECQWFTTDFRKVERREAKIRQYFPQERFYQRPDATIWYLLRHKKSILAWKTAREKAMNEGCAICGNRFHTHVHHLNRNHTDNRPENLIPLCPKHHREAHGELEKMN